MRGSDNFLHYLARPHQSKMIPALIFCSEEILPFSQLEKIRGDVIWDRDGHRRWIPAGRVLSALNACHFIEQLQGPDSPALEGFPWTMTDEYKPDEQK